MMVDWALADRHWALTSKFKVGVRRHCVQSFYSELFLELLLSP